MSNIIDTLEQEQFKQNLPNFNPGDTLVVQVKVREGNRERLQAFEGVCIAKRNRGIGSSFTVRKISHGEGVERVFQTHSPLVDSITVKRRGDVRRAKLYYLRGLEGKAARITEKLDTKKKCLIGTFWALTRSTLSNKSLLSDKKPGQRFCRSTSGLTAT